MNYIYPHENEEKKHSKNLPKKLELKTRQKLAKSIKPTITYNQKKVFFSAVKQISIQALKPAVDLQMRCASGIEIEMDL